MSKERQASETLEGIRKDHLERYKFAISKIQKGSSVIDAACGCGYGSWMLAQAGNKVVGIDIEKEALNYAKMHYAGPEYRLEDLGNVGTLKADAVVSFETIEHLKRPESMLVKIEADILIASVPNENGFHFSKAKFAGDKYPHQRHYTPEEFEELLNACGFSVIEKCCQESRKGPVVPGTGGIFLVYLCK